MKQRVPTPEQQAARDALLTAKEEANKGLEDLYDAEDSDDDPGFDSAKMARSVASSLASGSSLPSRARYDFLLSFWLC